MSCPIIEAQRREIAALTNGQDDDPSTTVVTEG
mgnify:CR=1 FL=1